MIYLGADHRGFELKEKIKKWLRDWDYEFKDLGAYELDKKDDYPDFAVPVARKVAKQKGSKGILICGSGTGMDIAANKVDGARSVLGVSPEHVYYSRRADHVNVLSVPAEYLKTEEIKEMVRFFLEAEVAEEPRYLRRIEKIKQLEKEE